MKIKRILNFLLVILVGFTTGYICIGGLAMIETTEKVKLIENKTEIELIKTVNYFANNRIRELPKNRIDSIDSIYFKTKNRHLSIDDKRDLQAMCHVYWYYDYPNFSFIRFLTYMPYTVLLFLTVGTAGILGSIARLVMDHVRNIVPIHDSKCIAFIISGFFMGIMVLAISFIVPTIFVRGDTQLNTYSIVLLCFFAGLFSDNFYKWIMNSIGKFLKAD